MDVPRTPSPPDASEYDARDDAPRAPKRRMASTQSPVATLPHAVLRGLFASFFVISYESQKVVVEPDFVLPDPLRAVACVSHEWNALAKDVAAEFALGQLSASVEDATREELLELRRRVTLQRKYLRTLYIEEPAPYDMIRAGHWEAALSHVPRLQELKLKLRNATVPQLTQIVHAAGRQCVEVHDLTLPRLNPSTTRRASVEELRDAVYGALAAWSKGGVRGGVRKLMVDLPGLFTDVASTRDHVNTIISLCPAMEQNCGFLHSADYGIALTTEEQWLLDIPTWTRFCASQPNLTTVEWMPLPFATVFFEIFGQFPKYKLKRMDFTPAMNWNWGNHLRDVDEATRCAMKDSGVANTTVNVHAALRACPNLRTVEVRWAFSERNTEDETIRSDTLHGIEIPANPVNPEIFGDDFCDALATYCPRLGNFILFAADERRPSNRMIRSFTDRGLRSLAKMSWLTEATIDGADITGAGLYALVVEHNATESSASRRFFITVGEPAVDTADLSFYEASQEFLRRILECDGELPCEHRNVLLQLSNRSKASIDRVWSAGFITKTKEMIQQIKERHPTACITLSTEDYDEGSCSRIEELIVTIGPKVASVGTDIPEEQIDHVIYNRVEDSEDEVASDSGMFEDSDDPFMIGYMHQFVNTYTEEDDPVNYDMQQFRNNHARRAAEEAEDEDSDNEDDDEEDHDDDEEGDL